MNKRFFLLLSSLLLTVYLMGSAPYYLIAGESLRGHIIADVLYTAVILIHEIFILIAVIFQWLGYLKKSRASIVIANWMLFFGGIVGFILIIPVLAIIPILVINIFSKNTKKKKTD